MSITVSIYFYEKMISVLLRVSTDSKTLSS